MINISIVDGALVFDEPNCDKIAIGFNPMPIAVKDIVAFYFVAGIRYDKKFHYSDITVGGKSYESAAEVVGKIAELCSVFKSGGGNGEGLQVVEDLESETQTLNLQLGTRYLFGTLTALTITDVPVSPTKDIVIWFTSGSPVTTLSTPPEVTILGEVKANALNEICVLNNLMTIIN